jgi:hypothetical protein
MQAPVCVCVCVCRNNCVCTNLCVRLYLVVRSKLHVNLNAFACVHGFTCECVLLGMCVCMCVCVLQNDCTPTCNSVHACAYLCMSVRTHAGCFVTHAHERICLCIFCALKSLAERQDCNQTINHKKKIQSYPPPPPPSFHHHSIIHPLIPSSPYPLLYISPLSLCSICCVFSVHCVITSRIIRPSLLHFPDKLKIPFAKRFAS